MKFGGALLDSASGIERVKGLVEEFSCEPLVIVVSALGKTTNSLEKLFALSQNGEKMDNEFFKIKQYHIRAAQNIIQQFPDELSTGLDFLFDELWDALNNTYTNRYQAYDAIVSIGEDLSSLIIYHYLKVCGLRVCLMSAKTLIVTDSNFTDASVNWQYTSKTVTSRVLPAIYNNKIVITQGFTGADKHGNSTTLGREGSDFTAAIIGNILDANEVTIWKNVPGLMNADPAKFPEAVKIDGLSYHEAIELAYYGASVIHPKTIQPLKQKNIPLFVRAYYDSSLSPTVITNDISKDGILPSIIVKEKQILLSISTRNLSFIAEENLKNIFDAFSKNKIHINLMQNSAVSFSVCFNEDLVKLEALISELKPSFRLKYNTGLQLITVRHYNDELVNELIGENKVYLFQKSRVNVQFLI
jgi:aspartate kinase